MYIHARYLKNPEGHIMNNCVVIEVEDEEYLQSYDTIMCYLDFEGNIHRTSDARTHTTSKHLKAFFESINEDITTNEFYDLLPLESA